MRVYRHGELLHDFSIAMPSLPPGMSTRSFIASMFGGPGGPNTGGPNNR